MRQDFAVHIKLFLFMTACQPRPGGAGGENVIIYSPCLVSGNEAEGVVHVRLRIYSDLFLEWFFAENYHIQPTFTVKEFFFLVPSKIRHDQRRT